MSVLTRLSAFVPAPARWPAPARAAAPQGELFAPAPAAAPDLPRPDARDDADDHALTAFDIGREYARHALVPPPQHLHPESPVRQGWAAGRALFGRRTLPARPAVRAWLGLRLAAWQRGEAFETTQFNADLLRRLAVPRCPVTREALHAPGDAPARATDGRPVPVRLNATAAWAAGHVALLAERAAAARGTADAATLLARVATADAAADPSGLGPAEALRLAVLVSFVTPLPHAQAVQVPLAVLPPPRVRLLNAAQALQAMVTLQFTAAGWRQRLSRIEALVPGTALRRDFNLLAHALIPRVLELGPDASPQVLRDALEDAWRQPLVQRRWARFAGALGAQATEALVQRIAARRLVPVALQTLDEGQAVEGWGWAPRTPDAACASAVS